MNIYIFRTWRWFRIRCWWTRSRTWYWSGWHSVTSHWKWWKLMINISVLIIILLIVFYYKGKKVWHINRRWTFQRNLIFVNWVHPCIPSETHYYLCVNLMFYWSWMMFLWIFLVNISSYAPSTYQVGASYPTSCYIIPMFQYEILNKPLLTMLPLKIMWFHIQLEIIVSYRL